MKKEVIIDFEFTGLDNTFIKDNEIIQFKCLNVAELAAFCKNYASKKPNGAGSFIVNRLNTINEILYFNESAFLSGLKQVNIDDPEYCVFYGFSPSMDKKMLRKYGIELEINDIREMLQLSKHEMRLATEGNNLEACYYIAIGKPPVINNHSDLAELFALYDLFNEVKKMELKEFLTVVPFGHCAGMPLDVFCVEHRRQADGYRLNNNDLFARSLDNTIDKLYFEDFS